MLGHIPVQNLATIDMDILCLENYLVSILFYDSIYFLDDYKEQWSSDRAKAFPSLKPLSMETASYKRIFDNSHQFYKQFIPRVEAGEFTDNEFKEYFDLLSMNVLFTWDLSASNFFLTQKMLEGVGGVDREKYSVLNASIYDQLFGKKYVPQAKIDINKATLITSDGKLIEPINGVNKLSDSAATFFAALNWMSFRTIMYTRLAENLSIDLFLHPIRQAFLVAILSKVYQDDPSTFRPIVDAITNKTNTAINQIRNPNSAFVTSHKLPLFVKWFASQGIPSMRFIDHAYELRTEKLFVEARRNLIELEKVRDVENEAKFIAQKNELILEIDKTLKNMLTKYSAGVEPGISVANLISVFNLTTIMAGIPQLPAFDYKIKGLEFLKHIVPKRGFTGICRTVTDDLMLVSKLGKLHEHITENVNIGQRKN